MTQPDNTARTQVPLSSDVETPLLVTQLAQQAVLPRKLDEGIYATLDADGNIAIIETEGYRLKRERDWKHENASGPHRISRDVTALDVDSFVDWLSRNTDDEPDTVAEAYLYDAGALELWADVDRRTITATLDGLNGWREHTATLKLKLSREFYEWLAIDGKLLPQVEFAAFIEDHLSTIGEPDAAVLLDICQTLEGRTAAAFKMGNRLTNGARQFQWAETVEAKAGEKGNLTIPEGLTLVMPIFQGSDPQIMRARFRYRPTDSGMSLAVKLDEPQTAIEQSFAAVVAAVQARVPVHINNGQG